MPSGRTGHSSGLGLGLVTFVLCLAVGLALVGWRAQTKAAIERARAQTELKSRAVAVQTQCGRAIRAAEALGTLARQSNGSFPNFAQAAQLLYATYPELASLEWQPGGSVSDIVPRNGNQRAIGLNVFKDPAYQASANTALQSGTTSLALPLPLYRGDLGMVVRVPVSQVTRAGENRFAGFVAVSMSLSELLRPANLEEVSKLGYDYVLSVPGSVVGQAVVLGRSGTARSDRALMQTFRVQNVEFRFALQRHGGWVHTSRWIIECVAVLLGSLAVSVLLSVLGSRKNSAEALLQANQLLAQETAQRRQVQEELVSERTSRETATQKLKADLGVAAAEKEKQTLLLGEMTESRQSLEAAFHQARAEADELKARFERNVQAHEKELATNQGELAEAQAKLKAASEQAKALQSSLAKADQAREVAESKLKTDEAKAREALADLQARLDGQKAATSKATAASAAKLKEAAELIEDLKNRLAAAEEAQKRISELEAALSELKSPTDATVQAPAAPIVPTAETAATEQKSEQSSEESAEACGLPKRRRSRRRDQDQIELFNQEASEPSRRGAPVEEEEAESGDVSGGSDDVSTVDLQSTESPQLHEEHASDTEPAESKGPGVTERKTPPRRPVDLTQLRRVVHEILPLLADRDPGARDCFKANRAVFRSAFVPAAYDEFEQVVREGDFEEALDRLTKLARKHGMNV